MIITAIHHQIDLASCIQLLMLPIHLLYLQPGPRLTTVLTGSGNVFCAEERELGGLGTEQFTFTSTQIGHLISRMV